MRNKSRRARASRRIKFIKRLSFKGILLREEEDPMGVGLRNLNLSGDLRGRFQMFCPADCNFSSIYYFFILVTDERCKK